MSKPYETALDYAVDCVEEATIKQDATAELKRLRGIEEAWRATNQTWEEGSKVKTEGDYQSHLIDVAITIRHQRDRLRQIARLNSEFPKEPTA